MKRQHQATTPPELPELPNDGVNGDTPIKGKSRACTECQRHKIKCQMDAGQSICRRCSKQGLRCQIGNSLQQFVTEDKDWKVSTATQITRLEAAVSEVLRSLRLPNLPRYGEKGEELPPQQNESLTMTREASPLSDDGIVAAPMRSLAEVTEFPKLGNRKQAHEEDIIARGIISESEAESLFDAFKFTMNQVLWGGVMLHHETLASVRQSSSLLLNVILTVASLHIPGKAGTLNTVYDEFVSLVSASTLKRKCSLDDIRAMCIGSFWLPGLSWRLSGQAVRWGTEIHLHQSFNRLLRGEQDQSERCQLWYLLYVCDAHFSIAYSRPPSIHQDLTITGYEDYLRMSPNIIDGDIRLMAQVALFVILTQVYHQFGVDLNNDPLTEADLLLFRSYNTAIDDWRALWYPRSPISPYVHTYPAKGVTLHYFFARLQVNSLALRAFKGPFSVERKTAADLAISSAMSTLSLVLEDDDVRHAIIGVPIFTLTMISFSAMFLLKVALKTELEIDVERIQDLVEKVIALMQNAVSSDTHLTRHIAKGLERMLARFKSYLPRRSTPTSGFMDHILDDNNTMLGMDQQWHDFAGTTFEYLASTWHDPGQQGLQEGVQMPWG